jgi:hypothetical protein
MVCFVLFFVGLHLFRRVIIIVFKVYCVEILGTLDFDFVILQRLTRSIVCHSIFVIKALLN